MKGFKWKYVVSAVACLLMIVLLSSLVLPVTEVSAVPNYQVKGLVLWGTSGVNRVYQDLAREVYDEGRAASVEVTEHIWASNVHDGDYRNYASFSNYWVGDALSSPGQQWPHQNRVGESVYLGLGEAVNKKWFLISETNPYFGAQVTAALASYTPEQLLRTEDEDLKKLKHTGTAVVLWAGEDWIVSGANASDAGWGDATSVRQWMGQDVEATDSAYIDPEGFMSHTFDPAPGVNPDDPHGDVLHSHIRGGNESEGKGDLADVTGSHRGKEWDVVGVGIADGQAAMCSSLSTFYSSSPHVQFNAGSYNEGESSPSDADAWIGDFLEATKCVRLDGTSVGGGRHSEVWNNSYMITEAHMSGWIDNGHGYMDLDSGFSYGAKDGFGALSDDEQAALSDELGLTGHGGTEEIDPNNPSEVTPTVDPDNPPLDRSAWSANTLSSYSVEENSSGILEHELTSLTDAWQSSSSLAQQVGITYGRILGGYSYTVEYLSQDEKALITENANQTLTTQYWTVDSNGYNEPYDFVDYTQAPASTSYTTDTSYADSSDAHGYSDTGTDATYTGPDPDHSGQNAHDWPADIESEVVYTGSDSYQSGSTPLWDYCLLTYGYDMYGRVNWAAGPLTHSVVGWYVYQRSLLPEDDPNHYHLNENQKISWYNYSNEPVYRYTNYYTVNYRLNVHRPGWYDWEQQTLTYSTRCDSDLAPNPGYADSMHFHMVGGNERDTHGFFSSAGYPSDEVRNNTVHLDAENFQNGVYTTGTIPSFQYESWYTNPEKPIMQPKTMTRNVKGYVSFWRHVYASDLPVYVFSLGPYDKAVYDDQRDENWEDTVAVESEVAVTKRITKARQEFNNAVKGSTGGKFVDMYEWLLNARPYFRYQNVDTGMHVTEERTNALHGKWYDRGTNEQIFHMWYSTILKDNPNFSSDEPVDVSLYALSCALTAYANDVVSPNGASSKEGEDARHLLSDVSSAGVGGAGGALGYGDTEYGFSGSYTATESETSSIVDYRSLLGIEDNSGTANMYMYARYGRLLQDLGIDKTGLTSSISPRWITGVLLAGGYTANAGVTSIWTISLDILKMLNPFQFLHDASSIAATAKAGMYDESSSAIVKLAATNSTIADLLEDIGHVYDVLAGGWDSGDIVMTEPFTGQPQTTRYHFSFTSLYLILFIIWFMFSYWALTTNGKTDSTQWKMQKFWPQVKKLVIRIAFFVIGVPAAGLFYTQALNGLREVTSVTATPTAQLVAATFVDFSAWVTNSRLSPPDGAVLVSEESTSSVAGQANGDSVVNLRKTAWAINKSTNLYKDVDASRFSSMLETHVDPDNPRDAMLAWDSTLIESYDTTDAPGIVSNVKAMREIYNVLFDYMSGDFYYSSDFASATLARFGTAANTVDIVGYSPGVDLETGRQPEWEKENSTYNEGTMHELVEQTSEKESWIERTLVENTEIFEGIGSYAPWDSFNVFANGDLTASIAGTVGNNSVVTYSASSGKAASSSDLSRGLRLDEKIGLSTLSMYNYLMTDFQPTSMRVMSVAKSANGHTMIAHYKVNLIGNGVMAALFYLNCFALLFSCGIVGCVYAIGMTISVFRKGIHAVASIPFAMMGVLQSIVRFIVIIISILIEMFVTIFGYQLIADFLLTFVTLVEGPLYNTLANIKTTSLIGNLLCWSGMSNVSLPPVASFIGSLIFSSLVLFTGGVWLVKLSPAFMRVFDKAVDVFYLRLCVNEAQIDAYLNKRPVYVPSFNVPVFSFSDFSEAFCDVVYGDACA